MADITFSGNNDGFQIGVNHGPINVPPGKLGTGYGQGRLTNHRLFLERPETPPSPLSTIPFTRDPDFVRRDTLLDQIHEKNSVPGSRIALIGLGGVG